MSSSAIAIAVVSTLCLAGRGHDTRLEPLPTRDAVRAAVRLGASGEVAGIDARIGTALAPLGDLNGDGVPDVALGCPEAQAGRGAVWILFLDTDGATRGRVLLALDGGGDEPGPGASFGRSLALVGDLEGDGRPELAIGAPLDGSGRGDAARGVVRLVSLNPDGSVFATRRIAPGEGGFPSSLVKAGFGVSLAAPGDLDGEGTPDLLVASLDERTDGGSLWLLRLTEEGRVSSTRRLEVPAGEDLCAIGDLDRDGRSEIAVGAPRHGRGVLWLVFLDATGRVRHRATIGAGSGDTRSTVNEVETGDLFGASLAPAGDLDGDGIGDLAVGAPGAGPRDEGALWILLLRADGTVRGRLEIGAATDALAEGLAPSGAFGASLRSLGDLDGDGRSELLVGAPGAPLGTTEDLPEAAGGGAVWALFLDPCFGPSLTTRDGYGLNPRSLSGGGPPRAGTSWTLFLDCGAGGASPGGLALLVGSRASLAGGAGALTPAGEVLIDLSPAARLFTLTAQHAGDASEFTLDLPADLAFCNFAIHVQGACTGGPRDARLSNALDAIVGR